MNTNRIGVLGVGKLGLSFALLAEQKGYGVIGCDTRMDYVQSLNNKTFTTTEPHINEYLQNSQTFMATTDLGAVVLYADILYCFVATPSLPDGSYDHSAIDRIVNNLQELHVKGFNMEEKYLVIGCTTMPGYCESIAKRLSATGISVCYNPEFIAQGDIINGLKTADMVLIGCDKGAHYVLSDIYTRIMDITPNIRVMSTTAAELTKISINCFLAMKIAYTNMIGDLAIMTGLEDEVHTILQAIGDDSRIGNKYLRYGFGFGGPCIPRDMRALDFHALMMNVPRRIPVAVDESNELHAQCLFHQYIGKNKDKDVPFIFTQLSYKKGVDMLVESQQYRLCKDLLELGYKVDITESPAVIEQVKKELYQYKDQITYGGLVIGYKIDL